MSTTSTSTTASEDDQLIPIAVGVVSGCVILFLVIALVVSGCFFLKKREKLCFKVEYFDDIKPFLPRKRLSGKPGRKDYKNKPKNKAKYHSLGRAPRFPKSDPFASVFLDNPLADHDDIEEDWSNPLFDTEQAALRDAAITIQSWYRMIRVRIPFVELREAVVLCQALYRGWMVRKILPQLKRDKQLKDQQKKKQAGWKKKGTLSALKFFEVKGFGFAEVEQLYGLETVRNAAEQLKSLYGGKGKMKLKLFISAKGLKLYNFHTFNEFAVVKISSVSFCTLDPKNKKIFAFINRKKKRNFCHVFQASESDAQKMVETMAEAFEVTFKRLEANRESRELARLAEVKKKAFHRQSQELDVEVASMMEMAETTSASTNSDLLDRRSFLQSSTDQYHPTSPADSLEGSISGSREKLIPLSQNRQSGSSKRSSLVVAQRAPHLNCQQHTNGRLGHDPIIQERKQVKVDIERHRLGSTIDRFSTS